MISEEEANAQLERLQQKLTSNLQEIDKNFTDCNQVLTSRIIPEIEKYADSTLRIWNHSKIWLYFFNSLNEMGDFAPSIYSEEGTNRPAHDSTIDSPDRWKHDVTMKDITTFSRLRRGLQATTSATSQGSSEQPNRYQDFSRFKKPNNEALIKSVSTDSTASSYYQTYQNSPPRSVPFAPSPRSLLGTPVREQAKILTENVLQSVGIRESDEEDSNHELDIENSQATKKRRTEEKGKQKDLGWDASVMMETDDVESRNKFENFLEQRKMRYQNMSQFEELPTLRHSMVHSPSSRYDRVQSITSSPRQPLASTPTMNRVLRENNNQESPTFMDMSPLRPSDIDQQQQEVGGAYEFTGELSQKIYNREATDTPTSKGTEDFTMQSNMTMKSGSTGQIPARFALQYFPEKFRTPPASIQLTRIFQYFADRPGAMITVNNIIENIKDDDYSTSNVKLLIDLLTRKRFLKRVNDKDAWTVRR